jgi:hypothetical protein
MHSQHALAVTQEIFLYAIFQTFLKCMSAMYFNALY